MDRCQYTQNSDICTEAQGMQLLFPMPGIEYYQVRVCKSGSGCAPSVCNRNTTCDHWNTASTQNKGRMSNAENQEIRATKSSNCIIKQFVSRKELCLCQIHFVSSHLRYLERRSHDVTINQIITTPFMLFTNLAKDIHMFLLNRQRDMICKDQMPTDRNNEIINHLQSEST